MGSFTFCLVWTAPINTTIIISYHGRLAEQSSYLLIGWGMWDSSQAVQISQTLASSVCLGLFLPFFFMLGCENQILQILKQVDCSTEAGTAPMRRKAQVAPCEKGHFLLHLPPTCCLTFCHSRFDTLAVSIRWVWWWRLLKLPVCSSPCPLSTLQTQKQKLTWFIACLLATAWKAEYLLPIKFNLGPTPRMGNFSSKKVKVFKSCKRATREGTMESVRQPD